MKKTNKLTKSALLTALSVALVCAASWLPTGRLALPALAALITAAVVIECGTGWAAGHYAAVCILTLLLSADKTMPLCYAFLFGHYAIFKHWIERLSVPMLRWGLKVLVCFVCIILFAALFSESFFAALPQSSSVLFWQVLLLIFILYDIAFSRLIGLYMRRVHRTVQ
ncbi:MAG: hypothetical protein E7464_01280 [Ruminococcaceae bacterium]|nr:hypothetical protein [Oscillospiraceae bacterium]